MKGSTVSAERRRWPRVLASMGIFCAALLFSNVSEDARAIGETRVLRMFHSHTNESIEIAYKVNGTFDSAALEKLNWFLRDWRTDEPITMAPQLFDVVWYVYREVGAHAPIKIMSAYRSPNTNAMLRRRSRAVAKNSQHMRGNAMDVHIPGVSMAKAREIGMRLQRGGVGYYPSAGSPFVHLDVGSVRSWPRMPRPQLERLFPDGKTVHLPADGRPLSNYEAALAEVQSRGGSALDFSTVTSNSGKSLFAMLFGGGDDEEDRAQPAPRGRQRGRSTATRVADARPVAPSGAGYVNSDNPMSWRAQPAAPAAPTVVAALPPLREAPAPAPVAPEVAASPQAAAVAEKSRFALAANLPVPPHRPQGAAFAQMVASLTPDASALPLPPSRPAGLGIATTFAVASESATKSEVSKGIENAKVSDAPQRVAVAGLPLPPQRPAGVGARVAASAPPVVGGSQTTIGPKLEVAHAFASVSAPLPPKRASVGLRPAVTSKVAVPRPVLDVGHANARASGQAPLAVPSAVRPPVANARGGILAQSFSVKAQRPSLGFTGNFVREIDASGGFRRSGK